VDARLRILAASAKAQGTSTLYRAAWRRGAVHRISKVRVIGCSSEELTEQSLAAIAFNIALCQSYNVSIPDFLGCSPLTGSSSSQTTLASLPSSIFVPTVATQQTVTGYIPAYTTPSGGNVATFTGDALLTGSCMTPVIATYTMNNGGLMEYPWVGCSDKNTACCPFAANSPGLLTICPHDYITAAGACCPS